jgi:hypothetical protein
MTSMSAPMWRSLSRAMPILALTAATMPAAPQYDVPRADLRRDTVKTRRLQHRGKAA